MKTISKSNLTVARCLFFAGLVTLSFQGMAQKSAVMADPKLEKMELADARGQKLNELFVQPGQTISLRLPVSSLNHGNILPAGSCKIKINLGSKLELEPTFDLNDVNLDRFFHWSTTSGSGSEIDGELVAPLPASFKAINLTFKVRAKAAEGTSTITANFLVTNHKSSIILSDEDGTNNGVSLRYAVTTKAEPVALSISDLEIAVFPNPIVNTKSVTIKAGKGVFHGDYQVSLVDIKGAVLSAKDFNLNHVQYFAFETGNINAGMYLIKVLKKDGSESGALKVSKL